MLAMFCTGHSDDHSSIENSTLLGLLGAPIPYAAAVEVVERILARRDAVKQVPP